MDSKRFTSLRELVGYDNWRMARMLSIDVAEVEDFCNGSKPIPQKVADELEAFADWTCELSHTETKRELAKKYLSKSE